MSRFMKYLKENCWDIGFVIICLSMVIAVVVSRDVGSWFYSPRLSP